MAKQEPKVAKLIFTNGLEKRKASGQTVLKNNQQEKLDPSTSISLKNSSSTNKYSTFDKIDGSHPWISELNENCITYPVRILRSKKISYFNFNLAKEMGLIPENHSKKLNSELEEKIIETFSLRIINEYDKENNKTFKKDTLKNNEYMATRYLQLQHSDKTGKTSGDGRGIWNGCITHKGKTWDISSRGTGVTALAPGAVEANKNLQTGSEEFGYGCGLAEMDELVSTAIMSEIFHQNGIKTERVLAVIDLGNGVGIGVRAGTNLMRPAHIFPHLKQGNLESLTKNLDFFIQREYKNKDFNFSSRHKERYDFFLNNISQSFAELAATLDIEYIFAWLDWDGDNMLANAGIIDYGSIRQFGLRYDQYRYDDVDRFSTNLNEQKNKIRQILQTYIQAVDFVKSKSKKTFNTFTDHHILLEFDRFFDHFRLKRILHKVGFDPQISSNLLSDHKDLVSSFAIEYDYLERKKTSEVLDTVDDGINRPALFNIRSILRHLPNKLLKAKDFNSSYLSQKEFYQILFAKDIYENDKNLVKTNDPHCKNFQTLYKELVLKSKKRRSLKRHLADINSRAKKINSANRITGNGIVKVVEKIFKSQKSGLATDSLHNVIQRFVNDQTLNPDNNKVPRNLYLTGDTKAEKLLEQIDEVSNTYSEDL